MSIICSLWWGYLLGQILLTQLSGLRVLLMVPPPIQTGACHVFSQSIFCPVFLVHIDHSFCGGV